MRTLIKYILNLSIVGGLGLLVYPGCEPKPNPASSSLAKTEAEADQLTSLDIALLQNYLDRFAYRIEMSRTASEFAASPSVKQLAIEVKSHYELMYLQASRLLPNREAGKSNAYPFSPIEHNRIDALRNTSGETLNQVYLAFLQEVYEEQRQKTANDLNDVKNVRLRSFLQDAVELSRVHEQEANELSQQAISDSTQARS
ncbi:MAG: hypothetical protein HC880_04660 [Bacteroidia bacterium]|nr:hypothetical protein [Bacteroidia bacterium]